MEKITYLNYLLYYLVFPGFLFLAFSGMIVSWIDRKLTARLQWRVGPPFLQPFYDLRKLFFKETFIPEQGNTAVFTLSPVVSLIAIVLISDIVLLAWINPSAGFLGDIIVVLYLFTLPPIAGILGASASNNPFAALGASREMKSVLSYELPFIMSLLVPVIKAHSISIGKIVSFQQASGPVILSVSGILAALVAVVCMQAKMGLVPFDFAEAETELAAGSQIEYSGILLAFWKLSKMMLLVIGPLFLAVMFWGGGSTWSLIWKYLILFVVAVVIKNTNPRIRIDQAVRFFWSTVSVAALASLLLAAAGW